MAPHSSTLAWKIPWTEEPGRLQSMGSLRVGHDWATSLSLFTFMHWTRKWQPTLVFLPGESQGRRSRVGCHLWGRRVGQVWSDLAAAAVCVYVCVCVCVHTLSVFQAPWTVALQARILEWVTISPSRGFSWPKDRTLVSCVSCISRQILYPWHHLGSPPRSCGQHVILNSGTYELSVATWEKGLCRCDWLRVLRWGEYPGLPRWALNTITNGLIKEREGELIQKRRHVITEAETAVMKPQTS